MREEVEPPAKSILGSYRLKNALRDDPVSYLLNGLQKRSTLVARRWRRRRRWRGRTHGRWWWWRRRTSARRSHGGRCRQIAGRRHRHVGFLRCFRTIHRGEIEKKTGAKQNRISLAKNKTNYGSKGQAIPHWRMLRGEAARLNLFMLGTDDEGATKEVSDAAPPEDILRALAFLDGKKWWWAMCEQIRGTIMSESPHQCPLQKTAENIR